MRLIFALGLLSVSLLPAATARAEDDLRDQLGGLRQGVYLAGTFGQQFNYNITSSDIIGTSDELEFSFDDTQAYSGAIGAYVGPARVEFETSYFKTDYTDIEFLTFPINIQGDLQYISLMGNVYYDIPLGTSKLNFYLGAGAGWSIITSDASLDSALINVATVDGITTTTAITEIDDDFAVFAYQFMGGLSYEVAPNVILTGGYRYRGFTEGGNDGELSGLIFREHQINAIEVGLRINF